VLDQNQNDPYVYPSTDILINKFGIKDMEGLQEVEGTIFALKNTQPLPEGSFDYDHLKAIHKHFFSDIYEWSGALKEQ
jgi:cell filamentation protein